MSIVEHLATPWWVVVPTLRPIVSAFALVLMRWSFPRASPEEVANALAMVTPSARTIRHLRKQPRDDGRSARPEEIT